MHSCSYLHAKAASSSAVFTALCESEKREKRKETRVDELNIGCEVGVAQPLLLLVLLVSSTAQLSVVAYLDGGVENACHCAKRARHERLCYLNRSSALVSQFFFFSLTSALTWHASKYKVHQYTPPNVQLRMYIWWSLCNLYLLARQVSYVG